MAEQNTYNEWPLEEDEKFEAFLELFRQYLEIPKTRVVNYKRVAEIKQAYDAICKAVLAESPDAKIEWGKSALDTGAAYIRVETDCLIVHDIRAFTEAIQYADNFEIFPLIDGNLRMGFMFNKFLIDV
ncbi:MAG TPA: hypothetical protein GX701_00600 [Clostridiales bacterium]|jgi:hypothetical protein|nr:hypothetical protein [Clostridiales bacterium]